MRCVGEHLLEQRVREHAADIDVAKVAALDGGANEENTAIRVGLGDDGAGVCRSNMAGAGM
jgi:hypothetical protein